MSRSPSAYSRTVLSLNPPAAFRAAATRASNSSHALAANARCAAATFEQYLRRLVGQNTTPSASAASSSQMTVIRLLLHRQLSLQALLEQCLTRHGPAVPGLLF